VRTADLEPYVALRYIAKLFKVLAALIMIMLLGEVVLGLVIDGRASITTLLGEATRLLVLAGMLWAAGDIAVLLVDAGHDLRVARILLGRINAQMHRREEPEEEKLAPRPRAAP
jgi:glucose uptake protein GlcU